MSDYDRWKTTPPEPTVAGKCDYCNAELYADCDYVHDRSEGEWFCDIECYVHQRLESGDLATEVKSHDA
jgi:hypothetical protein